MDKSEQRSYIRQKLTALSTDYCSRADQQIFRSVTALPEYRQASFLFCYISVGKEVDTRRLITQAWADGKRVAAPRCIGKGVMELFEIRSFDDLQPGRYRIPEPAAHCRPVSCGEIDFAVIPCLSCDRDRRRLGHGGGYYDRYLADSGAPSAALCREKLLLDAVCTEPHDRSVDLLITESRTCR